MITDGEKWHYLVANNLSRLLRGITSNHHDGFYCLNCFHSYRIKNKLPLKYTIHYLCLFRMFARKNEYLSK